MTNPNGRSNGPGVGKDAGVFLFVDAAVQSGGCCGKTRILSHYVNCLWCDVDDELSNYGYDMLERVRDDLTVRYKYLRADSGSIVTLLTSYRESRT